MAGHRAGHGAGAVSGSVPLAGLATSCPALLPPPSPPCPGFVRKGSPGRSQNGAAGGGSMGSDGSTIPSCPGEHSREFGERSSKTLHAPILMATSQGWRTAWLKFTCAHCKAKPHHPSFSSFAVKAVGLHATPWVKALAGLDPIAIFQVLLQPIGAFFTLIPLPLAPSKKQIHLNEDRLIKKKIFISCTRNFFFFLSFSLFKIFFSF